MIRIMWIVLVVTTAAVVAARLFGYELDWIEPYYYSYP